MVWNLIAVLTLAVAAPADVTVTTLDGTTAAGRLQSWSADEVVYTAADGEHTVPVADLLTLAFSTQATVDAGKPLVELTGGSLLPLESFTTSGKQATTRLLLPAEAKPLALTLPLDKVHAVRLQAIDADVLPQWQEIRKLAVASDLIVVSKRGGKSLDHLECVLGEVTESEVACELDGQELQISRSKVAGLVYYRPEDDDAKLPPCVLTGPDGLRIAAKTVRLQVDSLIAETLADVTVTWPLSGIVAADLAAGKIVFLSDTEPTASAWRPLVGLPSAASHAARFGEPRFNQSIGGGPLTLALRTADPAVGTPETKSFAKGLAIRSRSELLYRLPAGYRHFRAEAGIEPLSSASGNVMLSIYGDDRLLVEQAIDGSDAPISLDLDVADVKRLKIVVDYGENLDTGDWLNLCNARIVK